MESNLLSILELYSSLAARRPGGWHLQGWRWRRCMPRCCPLRAQLCQETRSGRRADRYHHMYACNQASCVDTSRARLLTLPHPCRPHPRSPWSVRPPKPLLHSVLLRQRAGWAARLPAGLQLGWSRRRQAGTTKWAAAAARTKVQKRRRSSLPQQPHPSSRPRRRQQRPRHLQRPQPRQRHQHRRLRRRPSRAQGRQAEVQGPAFLATS